MIFESCTTMIINSLGMCFVGKNQLKLNLSIIETTYLFFEYDAEDLLNIATKCLFFFKN